MKSATISRVGHTRSIARRQIEDADQPDSALMALVARAMSRIPADIAAVPSLIIATFSDCAPAWQSAADFPSSASALVNHLAAIRSGMGGMESIAVTEEARCAHARPAIVGLPVASALATLLSALVSQASIAEWSSEWYQS